MSAESGYGDPCSSSSNDLPHVLSISQAKSALTDAIAAMNHPHNAAQMAEARNKYHYGHTQMDMVRHMQFIFPIATEILMDVIANYGFARSGDGIIQFTLTVKDMEKIDPDIARLNNELRNYFLPRMESPIHNAPSSNTNH